MEKILELKNALENIGVKCELLTSTTWYCRDDKVHYGIELLTDVDGGEDYVSFCFTPQGQYITDCRFAPIKKQLNCQTILNRLTSYN